MTTRIVSIALVLSTILCVLQYLSIPPRNLSAQTNEVYGGLAALKLLTDKAIQGFQNNSTAFSISDLLTVYDILPKIARNSGSSEMPGGVYFLLGDTIKLLTLNPNPAVRNVTISYLNALEEQVTRLVAFGEIHPKLTGNRSLFNEKLLEYVNTPYGIKIDYPLTWIIRIDSNYSLPSTTSYLHSHIIASFYLPNETDGLPILYVGINSNLSKQFKQPYFTTEQYLNKSIESKKNSLSFPNLKLIQINDPRESNATLAGYPAYKIVWTYKHSQYGLREVMEVGTVLNGSEGYFLDYAASAIKFPKYLPVADKIKGSFLIIRGH